MTNQQMRNLLRGSLFIATASTSKRTVRGNTARHSHTLRHVYRMVSLASLPAPTNANSALGIHCDSKGNVYAGCGDGVHVWNPSGKLIGKIFTGINAANFQFAGQGRMVIMGRTKLFYATLEASGARLN